MAQDQTLYLDQMLYLRGTLRGHTDRVTAIATINDFPSIISASRDHSIIHWILTENSDTYGYSRCRLTGHSQSVEDVTITFDGDFALSSSCDGDLRLWGLDAAETAKVFVGHTEDVLTVAFSPNYRMIASGSRDKTIRIWNSIGECRHTFEGPDAHTDTVSCVLFSPNRQILVSGSWDHTIKIWDLNDHKLKATLTGHTGYVNSVILPCDGSVLMSGGQDGYMLFWFMEGEDAFKNVYSIDVGSVIHELCFSPTRHWLCAATETGIKIYDMRDKELISDLQVDLNKETEMGTHGEEEDLDHANLEPIYCTSLSWSADGETLFSGYSDGCIRVWRVWGILEDEDEDEV